MSIRPGIRLITVCAGVAGASMAAIVPAAAVATAIAEQPPASVGTPISSNLNSTGLLASDPQAQGKPGQASPLPVGGGPVGGLLGGVPAGLPLGG
ncbi:hypothetical protein ACIRNI_15885 [Streptomyces sp. NPDC093546]|uniref:hypothetical protein n=1 Tax=Streptomyces sp. NPDC093546 TaxID=3366040 RepID=UPI0038022DC2